MSLDDLRNRIRPELARASPYRWQEGIPDGPVDRFDMNTPADAPAWYAEAIARLAAIPPNDYPDASYLPLKRAIAAYAGVDARQVVVGAGCDEILALCAQLALGRGDRALVAKPTYQLYTVASRNAGAEVLALDPGDGLALARERARARGGRTCALVWLCSPNNPTGEQLDAARRRAHLRGLPRHRRARSGLPRARRRGSLAASIAGAREPRRHPHVLEGLRARRGARRLRPRAAGPGRGAGRPAPARLDLVLVGRRRRAGLPRDATSCRSAAPRSSRSAAGWPPGMRAAGVEVLAHAGNFVLARSPVPDVFAQLRRARLRRAHVRARAAAGRLLPRHRLAPRRQRAPAARARGARGRRGAGGRRRRARRAHGRGAARDARDAHRGAPRPARRRARARRDRPRLPRPHAHEPRVLVAHRPRPALLGRPLGRRAPHRRGLRDRARRGARHRARRPCRACAASARPARRSTRRSPRRPSTSRAAASPSSTSSWARPRSGACRRRSSPTSSTASPAAARLGLHVSATGADAHHVAEAAFKAVALALREAVEPDPARSGIASTKGVL